MPDGLGWFGALRPDGPIKFNDDAYFLAPFDEMWSMPSPRWFGA
jgi:hypothetical protein